MSDDKKNLHRDAPDMSGGGIKTSWGSGEQKSGIETLTPVIKPSKSQMRVFGDPDAKTCGGCRHFRPDAFKAEARRTQFFRELINGYQWKPEHLCDAPDKLGLCHMSDGTICGPNTAACDHWTPQRK